MARVVEGKGMIRFELYNPKTGARIEYYIEGMEDLSIEIPDSLQDFEIIIPENLKDKIRVREK